MKKKMLGMDYNITFGEVLHKLRIMSGLTQAQLSENSGIGQTGISLIEAGRISPTITMMVGLCKALQVDLNITLGNYNTISVPNQNQKGEMKIMRDTNANETLTFTEAIRKARLSAGMTQTDVGNLIGYSRSYISHLESGRVVPEISTLGMLCNALGLQLNVCHDAPNNFTLVDRTGALSK